MAILERYKRGSILVAQFNHANPKNPMNRALEQSIVETCRQFECDPTVNALVLTGGDGRSFCAGGDFNEVSQVRDRAAAEELIDRIFKLYFSILQVSKPTVAAVNEHAIGLGMQLALLCDWRVGSADTKMSMWELKHGVACTIGGYMLEKFFGRAAMTDMIYGCEFIPVEWAEQHKLLNEIVDTKSITEKAIERAEILCGYPEITFRRTKEAVNRSFIAGLNGIMDVTKEAHAAGFSDQAAEEHFVRILRR